MGKHCRELALFANLALAAAACGDNVNTGPVGASLFVETDEDTPVDIELVGSDANGDEVGFAIVASPQSGTLSGTAPNVTYTPDQDFFGEDAFQYAVSDAEETEVFAVTIAVQPVNDPPTVAAIADQTTDEDVALGPVVVVVDDVDDDLADLVIDVESSNIGVVDAGGIQVDRSTGNVELTLTPIAEASGTSVVTVTATDPDGETADQSFDFEVLVVNDPPTISAIADLSDHTLTFPTVDVTVADVDDAVAGLVVSAVSDNQAVVADAGITAGGADADRTLDITAVGVGTAQITVTVTDGNGSTDTVFDVEVTNNTPVAGADSYEWVGNTIRVVDNVAGLLANDTDGDGGDTLTVTTVGVLPTTEGGSVTIAADGSFTYAPEVGDTGADSFTYQISDGFETATGTATVNLDELVWYVDNSLDDPNPAIAGRSDAPFNSLADAAAASAIGDVIFVFSGNGTFNQDEGISLKDNQRLIGQGVGLTLSLGGADVEIFGAGDDPVITNTNPSGATTGFGVRLDDNNVVMGLTIDEPTNDGISGPSVETLTIDQVTINAGGNAAIDIGNNNPAADVTIDITDCTIDGTSSGGTPQLGIDIEAGSGGGTAALILDITGNTIVEADNAIVLDIEGTIGTGGTPSQITIDDNTIEDMADTGILLLLRDGSIADVSVLTNTIDGNVNVGGGSGAGLDVQVLHDVEGGATNLTAANNEIFDAGDECIHINDGNPTFAFVGTLTALLDQNDLDGCADEGIRVEPDDGPVTWNVSATGNIMTNNGLGSTFSWSTGDSGATMRVRLENNDDDVGFTLGCDVDTTTELGSVNNAGEVDLDCAIDTAQFITELDDAGNTTIGGTPVGILTGALTSTAARIDPDTIPTP